MSDKTGILFKAATVLLLREGEDGFEVFMVRRPAESAGFPNALVFPGGRLDPADESIETMGAHCRRPAGISDDDFAHRICGIRETFEEACILLARPRGQEDLIGGARAVAIVEKYRKPLHSGEIGLAEIAERENLEYACDLMIPFAHWVTPEGRPRRFDTRFFLAPAPNDQVAAHDEVELVQSVWTSPVRIVEESDQGLWTVVFVTRSNLLKLGEAKSIPEAFERARSSPVVTVSPEVERVEGGSIFRIPADAGYAVTERFEPASFRS
ncbi:MAG: hydrolase [Rhodospirillales bacterium]|jgi:8-oxo-dGTP pyrophosphatase MutT (NUDIX family)|nr:hydrolase [Rhodospirillales bacterium]